MQTQVDLETARSTDLMVAWGAKFLCSNNHKGQQLGISKMYVLNLIGNDRCTVVDIGYQSGSGEGALPYGGGYQVPVLRPPFLRQSYTE